MSLEILKKRIKENNLSGVFLFCGSEEYTKDHYVAQIRKRVDTSPLPEFNHIYFNASSDKLSALEDAIYSLPYMWETKLIEITDIENARITESEIEDYSRIFSDIPDYLTILAVLRADDNDDTRATKAKNNVAAFTSVVKDHGLVVEFETEKADKLVTWISRHFNSSQIKFDANVPREMINMCGNDMYILQSEILKLKEVYNGKSLTVADVHKYCCANSAYKYFDITAALNRRDMVSAKKILDSLDLSSDKISMAVGLISKNYSEMLIVKNAIDSGKGFDTIAKDLKIPQWRVGKIASASSAADMRSLSFAITQLSNADLKLKSFRGDPKKILELAFYRICTYGRKA